MGECVLRPIETLTIFYGIIKETMTDTNRLCVKCGGPMPAIDKDALREDVFKVLEAADTRKDAPNANICRGALKAAYGPKHTREIVDSLLRDKVVPATKAYHRRHMMFLDKQPLKPIQV